MATILYRLGRAAFRRSWTVIGVWLVLLTAVLGGGIALGGQTQESFAIPGTESQNALDRLEAVFPQVAGASATALVVAPEGGSITDERYRQPITDLAAAIGDLDHVNSVVGPFDQYAQSAVSDDDSMARIQVQFDGQSSDVTAATLNELTDTASIGEDAGLRVEFGGQVFQDNTFGITVTEVFGVIFAGVVLLITFGSLAAAGMPLLSALVGVGIVIGGITGISAFTTVSSTAPLLALMIGLAVGIDYSLFILSRHRNQLVEGYEPEESAAIAVGTAGSAVVFAGVTVIIALLGLLVVGIPFLSVMGVGAAFAVLIAIAVATTLLPAILGLAKGRLAPKPGSRAYRRAIAQTAPLAQAAAIAEAAQIAQIAPTAPMAQAAPDASASITHAGPIVRNPGDVTAQDAASETPGTPPKRQRPAFGVRWVRLVMRAPIVFVVAVVAVLGTLAIPALSLDLNLPDGGSEPAGSTQREAYDLTSEGFGPGYNGPLIVAVDITQTVDVLDDLESIGDELRDLDDVSFVSQGIPDAGLDTAIIQVIPESAPDAAETKQLVQSIRDLAPSIDDESDTPISVTGATAVGIDISNRLTSALIPFGLIVVGLSILLLTMVFRSILVPIKAAVGFLLSVVAAFGVVVAIFQWGWLADLLNVENPGPILSFMPIILMAVLFGLAMDYEVFIVSGMREEFVRTRDARHSVERGFGNAARVVTAAALIMFFVFFAFVPEGSGTIKPIALGLAVGIAFDAFLVRMTLVPAVMALLGRHAWWLPRPLARLLPDVDIEGEHLREHREASEWAESQRGSAISAAGLVVDGGSADAAPLSFSVPTGALVLVGGERAARRITAATLAGRLDPRAGVAQVAGHPLPSESTAVSRLVALADLASAGDRDLTVDQVLRERIAITRPWYRVGGLDRSVLEWTDRIRMSSASCAGVRGDLPLSSLSRLQRSVVLAAAAIAEGTPIVMIDAGDPFPERDEQSELIAAICTVADAQTTVVVGLDAEVSAAAAVSRPLVHLDLYPARNLSEGVSR